MPALRARLDGRLSPWLAPMGITCRRYAARAAGVYSVMLYNSATSMPLTSAKRGFIVLGAVGVSVFAFGLFFVTAARPKTLVLTVEPQTIPADGVSQATLHIKTNGGPLRGFVAYSQFVPGKAPVKDEIDADWENEITVLVRAGAIPGEVPIEVVMDRRLKASTVVKLTPAYDDRGGDGFPQFMRLASAEDRKAFRQWFTLLAELQMAIAKDHLPKEIVDCASLLRFAYRESLWRHSEGWKKEMLLAGAPEPPAVQAYELPHTPLGPKVFRVREGVFTEHSLTDGSFAEFADAKTLMSLNAHFVGRDVSRAQPGDLLFFRQLEQDSQFHSMIFLGKSHFRNFAESSGVEAVDWLVYHTGPVNGSKGQMKQVRLAELARHPDPKWRPVVGNTNFLGVFRWNILREAQ